MHTFRSRDTAVTLFSVSGECWAYGSRAEALRDLGASFIRHSVGPEFRLARFYAGPGGYTRHNTRVASFVLRDDAGQPMGLEDFADLLPAPDPLRLYRWAPWARGTWNEQGAVPGTGRRGSYRFHRRPRTMAEIRAHTWWDEEEGEPRPRAKRSPHNVPNAWDDLMRSPIERNWKAYRKTQYKPRKVKALHPDDGRV